MNIPQTWTLTQLGNLTAQIVGGGTPSKTSAANFNGLIPFMTVKDLKARFVSTTVDHISEEALQSSATTKVPADTLIVATRMSLGKIARPTMDVAINQDLKALFLHGGVNKTFVEYFWRSKSQAIQSMGTGTTVKGIRLEDIRSLEVPLAPVAEQKRIADKLDTVLTRVDAVNTRLARVAPLLKRFRQSVLAAATSGRLTEDWRAVNQINSDWLDKPAQALKDYVKLDMGFAFKSADFLNEGLRLLRGDNIEPGGLRWRDAKHIDEDAVRDLGHLMLKVGDLVLAMDRPIISAGLKLARVSEQDVPCVLVQRVCKFNCTPSLSKDFLFLVLQGTAFINHLGAVQNGSGVPHISGAQILSFKLQLPSADEQTEIVRRVETLFAFADRLEARLAQAQTAATRLTPALLAKAFRGELVPQDPNDEPAAELLRRLQAERASAPKASAGRGRKAVVQV